MRSNVVFLAADRNYLQLGWAAAKCAASFRGRSYDVVLVIEQDHGIANFVSPPGCDVVTIDASRQLADAILPNPNSAPFSYMRLYVPHLFLRPYKRAIYLDCDVLLSGSLEPLFRLDLRDHFMAGVEDCGFCRGMDINGMALDAYRRSVGLDPHRSYVNSGMIMFDVDRWIDADMPKGHKVFHENRRSVFADQDYINWVADGRIMELSPRWNFQTHYFDLDIESAVRPVVLHYLDIVKAWRDPEWCYGRHHAQRFHSLFASSPWPHYVPRHLLPGLRGAIARHYARGTLPQKRPHAPQVMTGHVARLVADRSTRRRLVIERLVSGAESGRYGDLSPMEANSMAAQLRVIASS